MAERGNWFEVEMLDQVRSPLFRQKVNEIAAGGVLRMPNGGVKWNLLGATNEENFARAVANVQMLFRASFPQFDVAFPLNNDGLIEESKRDDARNFIVESIGARGSFLEKINYVPSKKNVPQFAGSVIKATILSFTGWGLDFDYTDFQRRPNGYWTPENILEEASRYLHQNGRLTSKKLAEDGMHSLINAIVIYYPGKWRGLIKDLGLPSARRENETWSELRIREIAREYIAGGGLLTFADLKANKMHFLLRALESHYVGGLGKLQSDLGVNSSKKPRGYWNETTIYDAVVDLLLPGEALSQSLLRRHRSSYLVLAISRFYPGGWIALKGRIENEQVVNFDANKMFGDFFEEVENG